MSKAKMIISLCIKIIIVISVAVGFTMAYLYGHVNGVTNFLYFTNQSNLWLMVMDAIMVGFMIYALAKGQEKIPNILYRLLEVFTVCITITGFVYCFVLVPGFYASDVEVPDGYTPFNFAAVMLHMVVPTLAIIDFLVFTREVKFKRFDYLLAVIPTLYYFIFSLIGYLLKWDFGDGRNFPYFFLNYGSPAGIFGFSSVMPYFMGSFYWIILLSGFVIGLSLGYIRLLEKIISKAKRAA